MLDFKENPFIPGTPVPQYIPLERYLPPISGNIFSRWLKDHLEPGSLVLDPYGSHPWLPIEAARAGYSVLMACNNPIIRLITEVLSNPPDILEYQSAISELLTLKRGDMRLEQTLQALYESTCPSCGSVIQPDAFIWRKEEDEPFARLITCPFCGDTGEKKLSLEDKERLRLVGNEPLFWRRAIGRVAPEEEKVSELIAEAIKVYLPRQLYFLMTLLNKSESIRMEARKKKLIQAMLLQLFDKGNVLWNWPVSRTRPKSLVCPSQFREENLWLEIVNSHKVWTSTQPPLELTVWPDLPSRGGICIFPGRLRDLPQLAENIKPKAILSAIPRPNQAFWTLSAIWSGWLWGREAVTPLKSAIERRRYDWKWHTYALHSINVSLPRYLKSPINYFAIIPEIVPRFFAAVTASSCSTGFRIEGISFRDDEGEAQIIWEVPSSKIIRGNVLLNSLCEYSLKNIFSGANEPLSYNQLHANFFAALTYHNYFEKKDPQDLSLQIDQAESTLHKIIGDPSMYRRYGSESQNLESGLFWPRNQVSLANLPLSDRVEAAVFSFVEKNQRISFGEAEPFICSLFPGIATPSLQLIKSCLESYCTPILPENEFEFNQKELAENRENELLAIKSGISQLGDKFGFKNNGIQPMLWLDAKGQSVYYFYLTRFGTIGEYFLKSVPQTPASGARKLLIFPGSRSSIISLRLKRDLRLSEIARDWKLVKFRHMRWILGLEGITLENFPELIEKDPVTFEESVQPQIFGLSS